MSEKNERISIRDQVKKYVSISTVATSFGVSRPTMYMFMDSYDEGKKEDVPEEVRGFFDLVSMDPQPEDVKVYLRVRGQKDATEIKIKANREESVELDEARRELEKLAAMRDKTEKDLMESSARLNDLKREYEMVSELVELNPADNSEYKAMREAVRWKMMDAETAVSRLTEQIIRTDDEMARVKLKTYSLRAESMKRRNNQWVDDEGVSTLSIGDGRRSMVLFRTREDVVCKPEFMVRLFIDTPDGEMEIGRYEPEEWRRYVTIRDVIPELKPRYEVECRYGETVIRSGRHPLRFR